MKLSNLFIRYWDYTVKGLAYICKDGIDSINGTIKELEEQGYVLRKRLRNDKGQLTTTEYTILEQPQSLDTSGLQPKWENPILDNPTLEKPIQETPKQGEPILEEPHQLNTYLQTIDKSKKDLLNTETSNPNQSYS